MKKFLTLAILLTALIVGGCSDKPKTEITHTADNRIIFEADDDSGWTERNSIEISDGEVLKVDAKITSGKAVVQIEDKEYEFDKSGESFIDVSAGNQIVSITTKDGLKCKITFSAVPKN